MHNIVSGQMKDLIAISPKLFLAFGCIIYGVVGLLGLPSITMSSFALAQ